MTNKVSLPQMMKEIALTMFKKPFTRKYPFVKVDAPKGFRGKQIFYPERCIGCGLCARDCPAKAIELVEVSGKRMPMFHLEICIFCYQCAESCPRKAIQPSTTFEMASTKKGELALKPMGVSARQKAIEEGDM